MKTNQCLLLLLAFLLLATNVFGQETKNEESKSDDLLSRRVELDIRDVNPREMFLYLAMQEGLTVGAVNLGDNNTGRFDIGVELPLRDMMTYILAFDNQYRWEEDKGVINLIPFKEPAILRARISKLRLENVNIGQIVEALKETPEFKKAASELNLKDVSVTLAAIEKDPHYYQEMYGLFSPFDEKKFSVDFENLTVRQILNESARLKKSTLAWRYWEGQCANSEDEKIRCFSISKGRYL